MKTAIFKDKGKIEIQDVSLPIIKEPTDVIVKIVRSCVCGSDLWYYRGINKHKEGPIGHEFIGTVQEKGSSVKNFKKGDFVIVPFAFSDGVCPNCKAGFHTACTNGGFFGSGDEGQGGQAEYARVPQADGTLVKVPGSNFSEDLLKSLLSLSDVMGTGYHAAVSAGVKTGSTVAVVGDGAVGLSAVLSSKLLGAKRIIIMSRHKDRQNLAEEWGATDIIDVRGDEAINKIKEITNGIGVDAVMECVGTNESYETAFEIARPGAIVGRVGVPVNAEIPVSQTFYRNIGVRGGPAPVRAYLPDLIKAVLNGSINPGRVFDFTTTLDGIAEAYEVMDQRRAIKSFIKVSEL